MQKKESANCKKKKQILSVPFGLSDNGKKKVGVAQF